MDYLDIFAHLPGEEWGGGLMFLLIFSNKIFAYKKINNTCHIKLIVPIIKSDNNHVNYIRTSILLACKC